MSFNEKIAEIDKWYDCFMAGAFKFQSCDEIVQLNKGDP